MSAKWLRPTGTEKEYGRRPYITGKETSYVEMMQEVTDKARLDQGEFHLSEFKKPYLPGSYEQMEYQFSPVEGLTPLKPWRVDFPETTTTTQQEDEYGSSTSTGSLRWKREPPAKGEADHWYLVEVWNRIRETSQTTNGKVTKYTKTYYPAWFEIRKTKANTKGFKLEVSLPNAAFDSQGGVRGFWHGGYAWYNVERQAGAIQAIVSYMWERGYSQPTMTAKLTLSAEATGEVEIVARDGKTTLRKKVKTAKRDIISGCYYLGTDGLYYLVNTGDNPEIYHFVGLGEIESTYPHLSPEGLSIAPFGLYGEHSITFAGYYNTRYRYHREKTSDTTDSNCRLASSEPDAILDNPDHLWIFDRTYEESWSVTVIYTDDPLSPPVGTVTAGGIRAVEELKSSPIYFGDQTYWDEFSEDYDEDDYRRDEIIEGCDLPLAPFEVPWDIGETYYTRVMKKPGEEIYFCVRHSSLTPDSPRTYWVINSTGPWAYGDSTGLVVNGVQMLINNVFVLS